MKKVLKIIAGIFAVFFLTVVVILIIDISNDVEYKIVEEDQQGNGLYLRVTTEATSEDDLRTIVEEVKKEKRSTGIDAIWVWIHDPSKKPFGNLLAFRKNSL
ncbi:hypothetical protein [Bacillus sp. T3]|uniref:hypothetical protein n=1 Tax=Bacillus sp. T3 TaxID=467262 RepID=UPI002981F760|nr:hypothetical protein [Bacillus sp. T3]